MLWREKTLLSMIAAPPIIAFLYYFLSSSTMSDPNRGPIAIGLLAFLVLLTAALPVQNEISKERAIFQGENRRFSLSLPYTFSKIWLTGVLAIYQGLVWAGVHFLAIPMTASLQTFLPYGIIFFLIAFIGGALGLTVSALSRTAITTTNWILLLTVPQLILSGAIVPLAKLVFPFNLLSAINPSRYAWEALMTAGGYGQGLNVHMVSDWSALALMALCLVVILALIQQRAENVKL